MAGAAKAQRNVLQLLYKASIHQYVQQAKQLLRHLTVGVCPLLPQLLKGKAGEGPDGFLRIACPDAAHKGQQRPLVLRLKGLAAQKCESADIGGGKEL